MTIDSDLRINPTVSGPFVTDAVLRQPADIAKQLRQALTWHGAEVAPVADNPDRLVILTAGIPLAFVNRTELEDEGGAAEGLSTPEGFRA